MIVNGNGRALLEALKHPLATLVALALVASLTTVGIVRARGADYEQRLARVEAQLGQLPDLRQQLETFATRADIQTLARRLDELRAELRDLRAIILKGRQP